MADQRELAVGGNLLRQQPIKKDSPVIAKLPPHVKRTLTLLAFSNSVIWILFGLGLLGLEGEDMTPWNYAVTGAAVLWCVICIPFFTWFVTLTDWGQKGAGG
jgi:hypothetical protein